MVHNIQLTNSIDKTIMSGVYLQSNMTFETLLYGPLFHSYCNRMEVKEKNITSDNNNNIRSFRNDEKKTFYRIFISSLKLSFSN